MELFLYYQKQKKTFLFIWYYDGLWEQRLFKLPEDLSVEVYNHIE